MDKKFIRIISPFSLVIISALDVSVLAFSAYAIKKLTEHTDTYTVIFAVIDVIALLTAVFASKEVFSNGVRFNPASQGRKHCIRSAWIYDGANLEQNQTGNSKKNIKLTTRFGFHRACALEKSINGWFLLFENNGHIGIFNMQ